MVLLERLGAVLDSRLCVADGGVRGREFDPETLLAQSVCIQTRTGHWRDSQGAEVEYVGVGIGCADDLLALRRSSGVGCRAPEGRGRAAQPMSICATCMRLWDSNIRGTVCMQGSDVLATPDTVTRLVVWKDTNRPGPFPGRLLADGGHLRLQVRAHKPAAASWKP